MTLKKIGLADFFILKPVIFYRDQYAFFDRSTIGDIRLTTFMTDEKIAERVFARNRRSPPLRPNGRGRGNLGASFSLSSHAPDARDTRNSFPINR